MICLFLGASDKPASLWSSVTVSVGTNTLLYLYSTFQGSLTLGKAVRGAGGGAAGRGGMFTFTFVGDFLPTWSHMLVCHLHGSLGAWQVTAT